MVTNNPAHWLFPLTVELRRVFSWHVELAADPGQTDRVHLVRLHDKTGRRLTGLGMFDRSALAAILARLPNDAYLRRDCLAEIAPARFTLADIGA